MISKDFLARYKPVLSTPSMQKKWAVEGDLDNIMRSVVFFIAYIVKDEKYFHDVYVESYLSLKELLTRYDSSLPLMPFFGIYIRKAFQTVRELDYVVHYPSNVIAGALKDESIDDKFITHAFTTEMDTESLDIKDLPPILDVELKEIDMNEVNKWCELAEKHYGVKLIIYSDYLVFKFFMDGKVNNYKLWIHIDEKYSVKPSFNNYDCIMWQYSHTGRVDGIQGDVDLNTFLGDSE